MAVARKKVVPGSIRPRWPKARVVRWLEVGAVPALLGLWIPDWAGGYAARAAGEPARWAFPPVIAYAGAVVLLVACAQGVKNMGRHWRGVLVSGALALAAAAASVGLHLAIPLAPRPLAAATVGAILAALFSATLVLWFTIAKVAEITAEPRAAATRRGVLLASVAALLPGAAGVAALAAGAPALGWLRASVVATTAAFLLCRYGVHCYRTQRSIGATFAASPGDQFWP
ncbi:MAG TPA: hypothetical protein VLS93_15305 [Anaeromyxobacteraceae bacterium]|nr:hypothetical protein [Anaeromyxobacteraceae bacterium]